jgi:hypothetical protein
MTITEISPTARRSLADVARLCSVRDQTHWLQQYTLEEIASLLYRHKERVIIIEDTDTREFLGVGIYGDNKHDESVLHIVFIAAFKEIAIRMFIDILRAQFPAVQEISFIRRGVKRYFPVEQLYRVLTINYNNK